MRPMTLSRLALLVALYLSLDVSNPMFPGALTFGLEDSVEVRQADRLRGLDLRDVDGMIGVEHGEVARLAGTLGERLEHG